MSNINSSAFFYLTAEVRWFRPGRIPREIRQWFGSGHFALHPSTRTDRYLVFPSSESVGIKFREERFEVKALVRELDLLKTGGHVAGRIELWEKWSAGAESVPLLFRDLSEVEDHWTDVTKTRWIRVFGVGRDEINEHDPDIGLPRPEEGCYAEITEVEIAGEPFWTLGLESFGTNRLLEQHLTGTAQFLFRPERFPFEMAAADACSYPAFLRKYLSKK